METILTTHRIALVLVAAAGYGLATLFIKFSTESAQIGWLVGAAVVLSVCIMAEVMLLRRMDIGTVYLTILAVEAVLILAYTAVTGHALGAREALGGLMILTGALLVNS